MAAAQRAPEPRDDDSIEGGGPIQDPVLRSVSAGPDVEPPLEELLKDQYIGMLFSNVVMYFINFTLLPIKL